MNDALQKVTLTLAEWKASESEVEGAQHLLVAALESHAAPDVIGELKLRIASMRANREKLYRLSLLALQEHHEYLKKRDGVSGS